MEDKVLGLFNGRMEFGARALGNRSIITSPISSDMKDIINKKIKKRENFRPFAPAVLEEENPIGLVNLDLIHICPMWNM